MAENCRKNKLTRRKKRINTEIRRKLAHKSDLLDFKKAKWEFTREKNHFLLQKRLHERESWRDYCR